MKQEKRHTTIGLKKETKKRIDSHRAPGQSYDGFLHQLMDLLEVGATNKPGDSGAGHFELGS